MIYVYRVISVYINIHVFDVFCVNSLLIIIGVRTCVYVSGDKKCSFFRKFGVLCFLEAPVLKLPYYRPVIVVVLTVSDFRVCG